LKKCNKCLKNKDDFYSDQRKSDGLRAVCRDCTNLMERIKWKLHPEKYREKAKIRRSSRRDAVNSRQRKYYSLNKGSIRKSQVKYEKKDPTRWSEARKKWKKENPIKQKAYRHKRRAAKSLGENFTNLDVERILKLQKGKCAYCRTLIKSRYHIDHIIPLSVGGSNSKKNIQGLCPSCNLQKHAKDPILFMQSRGYLL